MTERFTRFDAALVSAGVLISFVSVLLPFVVWAAVHTIALVVFLSVQAERVVSRD